MFATTTVTIAHSRKDARRRPSDMPLLGFTMFKKEILSGEKDQSIRKLRKYSIKVDDRL
jgi:hypothetical protein